MTKLYELNVNEKHKKIDKLLLKQKDNCLQFNHSNF